MGFDLNKGGNFTLCPQGTFVARCYMVLDLGTHREEFQGKTTGDRRKLRIGFEFPTETHVFDEKRGKEPFTLSKKMTNSLGEKSTLRPFLNGWRGRELSAEDIKTFTFDKLLKAPALVTVIHEKKADGKVVAKISGVAKLVKGMECPPSVLPPILYSVDMGQNDAFKALPEWLREECSQCLEWTTADTDTDQGQPGEPANQESPGVDASDPF